MAYRNLILADGPTAYWPTNESSGTVIADEVGARDGDLFGTYTLGEPAATEELDKALALTDGDFVISDTPLPGGETQFTIEWWMRKDDSASCYVMSRGNDDDIIADFNSGLLEFFGGNFDRSGSAVSIPADNAWHHYAYTYDGATLRGYVDAALVTTHTQTTTLSNSTSYKWGRSAGDGSPLNGALSDAAVYPYPLTPRQLQSHYDTAQAEVTTLIWDFESGTLEGWVADWTGFEVRTDRAFAGVYSAGNDSGSGVAEDIAHVLPVELDGGKQIRKLAYFYQETAGSAGAAILCEDDAGQQVIAAGTNNPEFWIVDGNGFFSGTDHGDYNMWVLVEVVFDWTAFTADVHFTRLDTGATESFPDRPLINGTNVQALRVKNTNFGSAFEPGDFEHWLDSITVEAAAGDVVLEPTFEGVATTALGDPVDHVVIYDWNTLDRVKTVQPDSSGAWASGVLENGEYLLTYLAAGHQPITHGPYIVDGT